MRSQAIVGWRILAGTVVLIMALTLGTNTMLSEPSVVFRATELVPQRMSTERSEGMIPVVMHDLQQTRLLGIRDRVILPGNDGFMDSVNARAPVDSAGMAQMRLPTVVQSPREREERGLFDEDDALDGLTDGLTMGPDDVSWGWLADDVNKADTVVPEAEPGGFGFASPAVRSSLYDDRQGRAGTGFGSFDDSSSDRFIFQRQRDDRF